MYGLVKQDFHFHLSYVIVWDDCCIANMKNVQEKSAEVLSLWTDVELLKSQ